VCQISGLEHIHGRCIVHRDIKPENILFHKDNPSVVRLIDFGISRPCVAGTARIRQPSIEHNYIVGTLAYASLNSHLGIGLLFFHFPSSSCTNLIIFVDLSPRDDLESLAYTLLFSLKGSLPWQAYSEHGSSLGRIAQVREQKRKWTGPRLANYSVAEFGRLVDYARGLKFTEHINYARLRVQFANIYGKRIIPLEWRG
jgi:serine/threonine protein kinase